MSQPIVYLIGAGPGDVGLMTVKGLECIKKADTIVYDRLANSRLLAYARKDAELIYVGKTPDHHTLRQEEINALLVKLASEGKIVARLKGGDPFVFGRGGEEAEELFHAGFKFEIVPGITSAIAVPAYAGIPVTHRNITSTFTVITGHEDPTKENSQINWLRLAQDPGTLVFLMGVSNLREIVKALTANGKCDQTSVAVIRWGTRPEQEIVQGRLCDIEEKTRLAGITSPAIIIVGEVVELRKNLSWFENKTLFGKRILVTRAREQASLLSERLEELGAEALESPMISVEKPPCEETMKNALNNIALYVWIVFTSVNGVKFFFEFLRENKIDIRQLAQIKIASIGIKTKESLEDKGLIVDVMPEVFRAEKVTEALAPLMSTKGKILLPRSDLGRKILVDELESLGHEVDEVVCYQTKENHCINNDLVERLKNKDISAITFTSSSTVHNFMKIIKKDLSILEGVDIFSIGPVTSDTIREYELWITAEAKTYTIDGLVDEICTYYLEAK